MGTLLLRADALLRGRVVAGRALVRDEEWRTLVLLILLFAPIYGAVMGSYAFDSPDRLLQVLYSAAKMPLLLGATTALCLPAFFVLSTVLGLREDFRESCAAILAGQAVMSIALASLAPLTRVFYFSEDSYSLALLFNAAMFAMATGAAQMVMRRRYRPLVARNRHHLTMFWAWGALYVFVGIQMGWTLRPFVGHPGTYPTFFRDEPFTNAYVEVARVIGRAFGAH